MHEEDPSRLEFITVSEWRILLVDGVLVTVSEYCILHADRFFFSSLQSFDCDKFVHTYFSDDHQSLFFKYISLRRSKKANEKAFIFKGKVSGLGRATTLIHIDKRLKKIITNFNGLKNFTPPMSNIFLE